MFSRLRVAVFSTGDELREPGATLPDGAIYDANRHVIAGLLRGLGCAATDLGIQPDRPTAIRDALAAAAADHDLVITSGGMSTGDEDHVKAAVESLGALHFWRLAIKPGTALIAEEKDGQLVLRPAMVTAVRIYGDEEIQSWLQEDRITPNERKRILKKATRR